MIFLGGEYIYKPNNENGIVPMFTVNGEDREDSCNDIEDHEKAKMLRKYSVDPSKLGSKEKIFTAIKEKRSSLPNNKVGNSPNQLNGSFTPSESECESEHDVPFALTRIAL